MNFQTERQIRENKTLRDSFMELARQVFDLDFSKWYQDGYWTDRYIPYVLTDKGRVIANASANVMDYRLRGEKKRYIQIGTVMTALEYRGRGLSGSLIEQILAEWEEKCDGIYLYANDSVLDFYPKFGFVQAEEYQHVMPVKPLKGDFAKLSVESEEGRETLRRLYRLSNPYSAFSMEDCWGILMFYCGNYLKDQVWYSKEYDMICVAEEKGEKLYCHDLFGQKRAPLQEILGSLAAEGVKEAWLGFTPEETGGCSAKKLKEDDITLFIWNRKENLFQKDFLRFPYLSMA